MLFPFFLFPFCRQLPATRHRPLESPSATLLRLARRPMVLLCLMVVVVSPLGLCGLGAGGRIVGIPFFPYCAWRAVSPLGLCGLGAGRGSP